MVAAYLIDVLFGIIAVIVGLLLIFRPAPTLQFVVFIGRGHPGQKRGRHRRRAAYRYGGWGWSLAGGIMGLIVGAGSC